MVINIFGKRGSGKTTMIKGSLDQYPGPVAVIDVLGNFQDETMAITTDVQEFLEWLEDWQRSTDPKKATDKVFVLQPEDPSLAVDFVCSFLWEIRGGTLVLDETDAVDFPQAPVFDQIIRYGRNRRVHVVTGCRRPYEIPRNITAAANRIFVLQTQEPRDVEYYEKTILGERAEELMFMKPYHGFFLDYDEMEISKFSFKPNGEILIHETESLR